MLQNSTQAKQKQRHGCLAAYLIFVVIVGSMGLIFFLLRGLAPDNTRPVWEILVYSIFSLVDIVCIIAIFMWKKWGVWVLCAVQVIGFIISIIQRESIIGSLLSLVITIGFLFWVLNIGGDNKGWPQLE